MEIDELQKTVMKQGFITDTQTDLFLNAVGNGLREFSPDSVVKMKAQTTYTLIAIIERLHREVSDLKARSQERLDEHA